LLILVLIGYAVGDAGIPATDSLNKRFEGDFLKAQVLIGIAQGITTATALRSRILSNICTPTA